MRLLLKWLRPGVVPSPRRKKIPFGTRVQLILYRCCIKKLTKWYTKYAFSDSITLVGTSSAKVTHEYRDYSFEAEIKRLHMHMPDGMIECVGAISHIPDKGRSRRYFNCFHFEDHFLLEIDGRKISIDHGQGRSFVSTFKGNLKESDNSSLFAKYVFSGSMRGSKVGASTSYGGTKSSEENSLDRPASDTRTAESFSPKRRAGGLFGDDPLFGKKPDTPGVAISTPPASIKSVEGVTIDESF